MKKHIFTSVLSVILTLLLVLGATASMLSVSALETENSSDASVSDTPTLIGSATTYLVGDANLDKYITIADSTIIQLYLTRYSDFYDVQFLSGDVDGNGVVNVLDATYIQLYLSGYTSSCANCGAIGEYVTTN